MIVLDDLEIHPFDESLVHREILPYDPIYAEIFALVQRYVASRTDNVELLHIGSTAIEDLRGKPMVDIVAVTERTDLRAEQREFEGIGFHRRNVWVDRDDKPYVCGALEFNGNLYNINIHICHRNEPVHKDSLAFLELLRRRPDLRRRYERAKDHAHAVDPANPEIYNREKEAAIREIQDETS
jgi:GrpB-like predicted nucleotidyltransferase (UPF0157 family)